MIDGVWLCMDSVKGSIILVIQDAIEYMCSVGPQRFFERRGIWGCPFFAYRARTYLSAFHSVVSSKIFGKGGSGCSYCAAQTEQVMRFYIHFNQGNLKGAHNILNEWYATDLVKKINERPMLLGVICHFSVSKTGETVYLRRKHGYSQRVRRRIFNRQPMLISYGDGVGMRLRAGYPMQGYGNVAVSPNGYLTVPVPTVHIDNHYSAKKGVGIDYDGALQNSLHFHRKRSNSCI